MVNHLKHYLENHIRNEIGRFRIQFKTRKIKERK